VNPETGPGYAHLAAAFLRWAKKRSEAVGGIVESKTGAIRANGFCCVRFGHVRAWATRDSLRSAPQSRHR
jgi:hypothetical protein